MNEQILNITNSSHIQNVVVMLLENKRTTRIYSARTNDTGTLHSYTVRAEMRADGRYMVCNCPSGAKNEVCRHIIKVGMVDSQMFEIEPYFASIANYKAHLKNDDTCSVCKVAPGVTEGKCRECFGNTVSYLPNSSTKKTERIGGIRIQ